MLFEPLFFAGVSSVPCSALPFSGDELLKLMSFSSLCRTARAGVGRKLAGLVSFFAFLALLRHRCFLRHVPC